MIEGVPVEYRAEDGIDPRRCRAAGGTLRMR